MKKKMENGKRAIGKELARKLASALCGDPVLVEDMIKTIPHMT